MPEPETAKYEELLLTTSIMNAVTQVSIAILAAQSLGKQKILQKLECVGVDLDEIGSYLNL